MADYAVRAATLEDLAALTDIYNHYVATTAITFDLQTFTAATRRAGSTITPRRGHTACWLPPTL